MKVKFISTYFANTAERRPDKIRVMSGRRFRKGVEYELSDEEYKQAKKDGASFKVLSGTVPAEKTPELSLKDFDAERAAGDAYDKVVEEAEQAVQKRGPGRPRKTDK
jgi:hypothetical protein